MKRLHFYILATVALLTSCSKEKDEIPFTFNGFFTAYTNSNSQIYKITDDMGNTYNVKEDDTDLSPNTTTRIVATVKAEDGDTVIASKLFPLSEVATLDSKVHSELKVKDPVILKSIYLGGGYLNVHLGIKVKNENTAHNVLYSRSNGNKNLKIILYHNAHNDEPIYTQNAFLSIPVWIYIHKNDTISFCYRSFEGDRVEKLIYR